MGLVRRSGRVRSGQTGTEYFMLVAVVVVAVVAASYAFIPGFHDGVGKLADDVSTILESHEIGGIGLGGTNGPGGSSQASPNPVTQAAQTGGTAIAPTNSAAQQNTGINAIAPGTDVTAAQAGNTLNASNAQIAANQTSGQSPTSGASGQGTYSTTSDTTQVTRAGGNFGRFNYGDFVPPDTTTTNTTITGDNAGGGGNEKGVYNPSGTVQANVQGNIANTYNAAVAANPSLSGQPVCGPALLAALTGQPLTPDFINSLGKDGYLQQVTVQTTVTHDNGGTTSSSTSTTQATPGVMTSQEVASYLHSVGWTSNVTSHNNMDTLFTALSSGEHVVVRYDACGDGSGSCGHFAQVLAIHNGYVLLDSSSGTVWMPIQGFLQRWKATGLEMVTANPPGAGTTVAQATVVTSGH